MGTTNNVVSATSNAKDVRVQVLPEQIVIASMSFLIRRNALHVSTPTGKMLTFIVKNAIQFVLLVPMLGLELMLHRGKQRV